MVVKVKKRCVRCGVVRAYKPRIRHCREKKFGGSYWCYGELVAVAAVAPTPKPKPRPQEVARRKMQQTERALAAVNEEVFTLAKRLGVLSKRSRELARRASRYAAAASMSDAEVEQQRLKRLEQQALRLAKKRTRQIDLEEE
jgi:hypothetical protein